MKKDSCENKKGIGRLSRNQIRASRKKKREEPKGELISTHQIMCVKLFEVRLPFCGLREQRHGHPLFGKRSILKKATRPRKCELI